MKIISFALLSLFVFHSLIGGEGFDRNDRRIRKLYHFGEDPKFEQKFNSLATVTLNGGVKTQDTTYGTGLIWTDTVGDGLKDTANLPTGASPRTYCILLRFANTLTASSDGFFYNQGPAGGEQNALSYPGDGSIANNGTGGCAITNVVQDSNSKSDRTFLVCSSFEPPTTRRMWILGKNYEKSCYGTGQTGISSDLVIGNNQLDSGSNFNGTVYEFALFDVALSSADIRNIYQRIIKGRSNAESN